MRCEGQSHSRESSVIPNVRVWPSFISAVLSFYSTLYKKDVKLCHAREHSNMPHDKHETESAHVTLYHMTVRPSKNREFQTFGEKLSCESVRWWEWLYMSDGAL